MDEPKQTEEILELIELTPEELKSLVTFGEIVKKGHRITALFATKKGHSIIEDMFPYLNKSDMVTQNITHLLRDNRRRLG